MRYFDVLIFDLGGTLLYFSGDWNKVYPRAFETLHEHLYQAGMKLEKAPFLAEFSKRLADYYTARDEEYIELSTTYVLEGLLKDWGYPQQSEEMLHSALKAMYSVTQAHWIPESDTLSTLQKLHQDGYRLGLLSNASDDNDLQELVDKAAIRPYLDLVLTSARAGFRKPSRKVYQKALDMLQVRPERTAMIGDSLEADILGAQQAGLRAIWITRRADMQAEQKHEPPIQPDWTISTLSELPPLLASLANNSDCSKYE